MQRSLPLALAIAIAVSGAILHGACMAAPAATKAPAATVATPPGEAAVRKAIESFAKGVKVESVRASPVPGLMEVDTSDDIVYVTEDGKYLMTGNIVDVAAKRDLTEATRAAWRHNLLKNVTPAQMIAFAPPHPKYTVTVFTDVDCGFCRKLHSQIADYNKAGIAVDYLFFPRTGIGSESYDKAVSVWCASDRRQALTDAKKGLPLRKLNCTNPVTMDYNLGLKVGVDGTPAIYAADGTQIGGYLTPAEMKTRLDKMAAGQPSSS
ncbi:MAG TPA: thioredoxin fold domain-containing protein [Xanthomonadaceae bacterium]|jgi:thiol:disulfide interchange protein DsbC